MSEVVFSVVVPCFNQADFLPDAIDSLLKQTFDSWEVIIVNDGSTDGTKEVADGYVGRDCRIRLVTQANQGLSAARNAGIVQSKGEYLVFLDADDWLYPDCLKVVHGYFQNHIAILISGYAHWKGGVSIQEVSKPTPSLAIGDFIYSNFAPPVAFVLKKDIIEEIGLFDTDLKSAEDWDLWIRAAKCGLKIVSIPEILVAYRYSDQSMSRDGRRMYHALKEVFLRIPQRDSRINSHSQILPKDIDISRGILGTLMPCLGVLLTQGKVAEAVELFQSEQSEFDLKPTAKDFLKLNSYLSFRYWNTREELGRILIEFGPLIFLFVDSLSLRDVDAGDVVDEILLDTRKKFYAKKYGRIIGRILFGVKRLLGKKIFFNTL